MDITKARQALERTKRASADNVKRGYNKKCEDAIAEVEKILSQLPADQAEQFKPEVDDFSAGVRKGLGLTWVEDAKKNVQRHLKYAEDSMAKGNAKNVLNAKDVIIKTVDKSEGRSYFEYHESSVPFLAEIDAMYQKIDAWLAANDPSAKPTPSPAPPAASPKPATSTSAPAPASSSSSTSTAASASAAAPAAQAPGKAAPAQAAAAPAKEPEYKRTDDGAFLPVFDTSPSTGLPRQVLSFLPAMVNSYGKQCNQMYAGITEFIEEALPQCSTPFDIEKKKHELSQRVPSLTDKIDQLEKVIPKAKAVDEKLAQILETEIASARSKVNKLVDGFESTCKASAPTIAFKNYMKHIGILVQIIEENKKEIGHLTIRELPSEYQCSSVRTDDLWTLMEKILDKVKASAQSISEVTGKPFDIATEEPSYTTTIQAGVLAFATLLNTQIDDYVKDSCFRQAHEKFEQMRNILARYPVPGADDIVISTATKIISAKDAHDAKLVEEAKARKLPRRNWSGGDEEAEKLEKAALEWLDTNFQPENKTRRSLLAQIVGGNWSVIKKNYLDEPIQWNILMAVVFYEDPEQGYEEPGLTLMYLGPMAREMNGCNLPFVHTSVAGSDMFFVDNLPEPFKSEISAKINAWENAQEEKRQKEMAAMLANKPATEQSESARISAELDIKIKKFNIGASELKCQLMRRGFY